MEDRSPFIMFLRHLLEVFRCFTRRFIPREEAVQNQNIHTIEMRDRDSVLAKEKMRFSFELYNSAIILGGS